MSMGGTRLPSWGRAATIAVAGLAAVAGVGAVIHAQTHSTSVSGATTTTADHSSSARRSNTGTSSSTTHRRVSISIDLEAHSTTDPSSVWVVVNKTHPIKPLDFTPAVTIVRGYRVARSAARPLGLLLNAGDAAGLGFKIESGYRSYGYQVSIHDEFAASEGGAGADRVSARAGYSEHQTGLAVDLISLTDSRCNMQECFAATSAGRWLASNAWRYGFIVRYRAGDERITGYSPEPWHIRYVGRPLAAAMRIAGVSTLEQVFHISGGNYR
jgi:D-alanyl-D-alanine carboxypeptidase